MNIVTPYPEFENVFADITLKGVFYPLCVVSNIDGLDKQLFVISSNGLRIDDNYRNEFASSKFSSFQLIGNKYHFKGDLRLYKGSQFASEVRTFLDHDFLINGLQYLLEMLSDHEYMLKMKNQLPKYIEEFDVEFYIKTFYSFSIIKLNFELTGEFSSFGKLIDNSWSSGTEYPRTFLDNPQSEDFLSVFKRVEKSLPFNSDIRKIGLQMAFTIFQSETIRYFYITTKQKLPIVSQPHFKNCA